MEKRVFFILIKRCLILDDDFGYGRKRRQVIDPETGEMIAEVWHNRPENGIFPLGVNVTTAQAIFTREESPDKQSEYIHVRDADIEHSYYAFWNKKNENKNPPKKRSTGNKKSYVKLFSEKLAELDDKLSLRDMGFLVKLVPLIDWDSGALIGNRDKEKLTIDDIAVIFGENKRNAYRLVNPLIDAGVMFKKGPHYYINRSYMAKG